MPGLPQGAEKDGQNRGGDVARLLAAATQVVSLLHREFATSGHEQYQLQSPSPCNKVATFERRTDAIFRCARRSTLAALQLQCCRQFHGTESRVSGQPRC